MTSSSSSTTMEAKLFAATRVPAPRPEFLANLGQRLAEEARQPEAGGKAAWRTEKSNTVFRRPAWIVAVFVLAIVVGAILVAGPQRVAAAFRQLLGYIPGVGVVDQSAPIRVLAEPVSLTREGITLSVNSVTITADRTIIDYGVSGVSLSAYPKGEAITGCIDQPFYRLPDGAQVNFLDPIPSGVYEVTFVMPCIFNTLDGTVPKDWELPLRFIDAPPDLTVLPVIDVTSTPMASTLAPTTGLGASSSGQTVETSTSVPQSTVALSVEKVIETEDGYILIGLLKANDADGTQIDVTGNLVLHDANGNKVSYTYPEDINEYEILDVGYDDKAYSVQFKAAGVAFPLTIEFQGSTLSVQDPEAQASVTLDVGTDPQPGQDWTLDQEIELARHKLRLVSVRIDSRNDYTFQIEADENVWLLSVAVDGYTATGSGGGTNYQGVVQTSVSFAELPKGNLTFIFSDLIEKSETQTWQVQWQPDQQMRSDWPTVTVAPYQACVREDNLAQIGPLPDGLDGQVLTTHTNPELRLSLIGLDGGQERLFDLNSSRGAVTWDGTYLAYPAEEGIVILNLDSGEKSGLAGIQGGDLRWSPDGSQIAYVTAGDAYGIFVVDRSGENPRQLSNLGYESIAGWSPDGGTLYYAIPGSSEDGWQLKAVDVGTGEQTDLFILANSSGKAPFPVTSPDGQWIAYRGRDNASLYLMKMDGTQNHLLIEKPGDDVAVSGIAWGPDGGLLGVSLISADAPDGEVLLMQWESCEVYRLPGVSGELDGVIIR